MSLVLQFLPRPNLTCVESLPIMTVDGLWAGGPVERGRAVRREGGGREGGRERGRGEGRREGGREGGGCEKREGEGWKRRNSK